MVTTAATVSSGEKTPRFDLCGGHPALDFVNSLDNRFGESGPAELLQSYDDLLRFAGQNRLLEPRQARLLARAASPEEATRALRSARELREALASVFYGQVDGRVPDATDLHTIERHFHNAGGHRELRWQASRVRWDWDRYETNAELPVWALAQSACELVLSDAMDRVSACGAESCRWLFLDTSKNHTRRWCKMEVCGNRMKARRFQARRGE